MQPLVILGLLILLSGCAGAATPGPPPAAEPSSASSTEASPGQAAALVTPIAGGLSRVTKKPFGIRVSPSSSPVQPERFTGYHTGTDFETTPEEQAADVPVSAACTGAVLFTGWVKGYGGVLVQNCTVAGRPVTVLYGHLNAASIRPKKSEDIAAGSVIGMLGKGDSTETDGERKHLHLAVHRGTAVELRGYVQTEGELAAWIDPATLLP